ncbi:hypothetical protein B9T38_11990 [Acinetobacter sp. ANC 4218]|nr:hypothetical protein B9T38_11990 [Acinetobacter sp. ANC 4218]
MGTWLSKYTELKTLIDEALSIGQQAADKTDDVGTANLDKVVICGLKGVRESTLKNAGINCYKHWSYAGAFIISRSYGQGDKNTVGIEAAKDYLKSKGVDCYVHSRMD